MNRFLRTTTFGALVGLILAATAIQATATASIATASPPLSAEQRASMDALARKFELPYQRKAAAARRKLVAASIASRAGSLGYRLAGASATPSATPGGQPDYFGMTPNWAFSPSLRKFVDTLPGLGPQNANNLGNYIPVGKPDTKTYPGCDYYVIELRQYTQKFHSDLPATTLRGYVQVNKGTDANGNNTLEPDPIHYLGPFIMAKKNRPVRIKFTNKLPTGQGGNLFLPIDETVMGAGTGPDMMSVYAQNRGTIHLHGGRTIWISDGNPHQWITPAGEDTPYPRGVSVHNVPDMPDPGDGSMTFYYSNQQSARLLWFHDHANGITRVNVYAGEAAGYLITDDTEQKLVADKIIPSDQIPLIIQDKTFVDAATVLKTDPTWNWGTTAPVPHTGDLWFPHVYMPNQDPYDVSGANVMGRWDYGPWFWPPTPVSHGTTANPYYDPSNAPWEPPVMPSYPATSATMEAYMDTALVNGEAYPTVTLQPKAYRFRILNAANDRMFNLQLYYADPNTKSADGRRNTEVKMVPAAVNPKFPSTWPTDGRDGGVPDPSMVGPDFIQIGNESGFLAMPTTISPQPITWNGNMKAFTWGNVANHSLLVAPAERADVIIDFSKYAGKTLILYNDAPAGFPANDPRNDYYTNAPDQTDSGGKTGAAAGFSPNTRTIMQIKIAGAKPAPAFNYDTLVKAFTTTATHDGVFKASQDPIIVAQPAYNDVYGKTFPTTWPLAGYANINDYSMQFMTSAGTTLSLDFQDKGIHDEMGGAYDDYGRMMGALGTEIHGGDAQTQQFIKQSYIDPSTENITDSMVPMSPVAGDGTQIWKITHNGVDTHPIHFHLFDVQLINRVGWDGAVEMPDANELGWKDTVRVSPLEDTIVALRPVAPKSPFGVPDSIRPLDPDQPIGAMMGFSNTNPSNGDPLTPPTMNEVVNFGWEYMWHCHILSHEEMGMMRPTTLDVARSLAATPVVAASGTPGTTIALTWTDGTPADNPATWGNPSNEVGFRIERAEVDSSRAEKGAYTVVGSALANMTTLRDATTDSGKAYAYRVIAYNAAGESTSSPTYVAPAGFFAQDVVTPHLTGSGTISPAAAQMVPSGSDSPTFTIVPDAGFHLLDTWVDGASVTASYSVTLHNVQIDHAIWGFIVPDTIAISPSVGVPSAVVASVSTGRVRPADASAGGSISPSSLQNVTYGTDLTFEFTPDPGYHVEDVLVDGESVGAPTKYQFQNVHWPHRLSVSFAPDVFHISPTSGSGGSVSPDSLQTLGLGGSKSFTVTPASGFHVSNVIVDGVSRGAISGYTFTNVSADHTIDASFVPKTATSISLLIGRAARESGRAVRASGQLLPRDKRRHAVVVQMLAPGSRVWTTAWSGSTSATGAFSHTIRLSKAGAYKFRALFTGTSLWNAAVSKTASKTLP